MQRLITVTGTLVTLDGVTAGPCYRKDLKPEHKPEYVKSALPHTYTTSEDLPQEFSWRNVNGTNWLTPSINQHIPVYCGSCWLHGAISVLNDRLKLVRKGAFPEVMLARQVVLNCGAEAGSCNGGTDVGLYKWIMKEGVPTDTCQTYEAKEHECSDLRTCMNCDAPSKLKPGEEMCYPVQRYGKYHVAEWGPIDLSENPVHNIKAEIYRRGPVSCNIDAGPLVEGRYKHGDIVSDLVRPEDGKPWETDHVISVVGWGVDSGVAYWWVRNSWGEYWGEDGFVRVAMGKNVMNIENDCNWAVMAPEPVVADYGPSDADRLFPTGNDGSFMPPPPSDVAAGVRRRRTGSAAAPSDAAPQLPSQASPAMTAAICALLAAVTMSVCGIAAFYGNRRRQARTPMLTGEFNEAQSTSMADLSAAAHASA